ncbi:MAG TPA: MBL fold metallo-hydrolase [Patescibacteria group bacterium]|nr:MBL fold metallo-hydrolase [Patescibacteria group bacterium]
MRIGEFTLTAVETGTFRLDGGTMFGVVPKVLWSTTNPADENNRIAMAMRALCIEGGDRRIVVDSGAGTKLNEKMIRNYVIDGVALGPALTGAGIDPETVTDAIATHLHFDHAGGFTYRDSDGAVRLALPRAIHYVQRRQWEAALHPNEKDRASFFPENYLKIGEEDMLELIDGEEEIIPGVTVIPTNGHTPGHQVVLIESNGERLLYCGDLIPLASHVNLPYIMSFDHLPLETLEEKRRILGLAADEGWILFFEHDPVIPACTVRRADGGRFEVAEEIDMGNA